VDAFASVAVTLWRLMEALTTSRDRERERQKAKNRGSFEREGSTREKKD